MLPIIFETEENKNKRISQFNNDKLEIIEIIENIITLSTNSLYVGTTAFTNNKLYVSCIHNDDLNLNNNILNMFDNIIIKTYMLSTTKGSHNNFTKLVINIKNTDNQELETIKSLLKLLYIS